MAAGEGAGYPDGVPSDDWKEEFRAVFDRALGLYESGRRTPETCVGAKDREFLAGLGCSAQELFDFVEDHSCGGEPSFEEVVGVTSLRRDWFLAKQGGQASGHRHSVADLPAKTASLAGVEWLPRIVMKAEAKLRGELPAELMYGCGGDRAFLGRVGVGLTEFLAAVRDAEGDTKPVVALVKRRGAAAT